MFDLIQFSKNYHIEQNSCCVFMARRGHIFYSLTASVVSLDITITESGIILNSFQVGCLISCFLKYLASNLNLNFLKGGTTPQIQDAIGTTMSFQELKRLLFKSGINLFPDKDVFCYCESTSRNCNHFIFL